MIENERTVSEFLITGKREYGESSLIINGFSPDFGRVDFILKGGKRIGKKNFANVDLLNLYEFTFNFQVTGLITLAASSLLEDFSNVASDYKAFELSGKLLKFINSNCQPNIPQPGTFNCLCNIMNLFVNSQSSVLSLLVCEVAFKLTFLYENGCLPDLLDSNETISNKKYKKVIEIIQAGESGFKHLPPIEKKGWQALLNWVNALGAYHQLRDF